MYYLDFKHADKIIAISDCDKADMYKCYPKWTDKVKRIYNPIVSHRYNSSSFTNPVNITLSSKLCSLT